MLTGAFVPCRERPFPRRGARAAAENDFHICGISRFLPELPAEYLQKAAQVQLQL